MTRVRLAFVQAFQARGQVYFYFRRAGAPRVRLPGVPGSSEFMRAYEVALAASETSPPAIGAHRSVPGSIAAAVAAYATSARFKYELAPAPSSGNGKPCSASAMSTARNASPC